MMNILTLSMLLTLSMMIMKHPLSITIILIIQSLMIAMITGPLNYDFWFSYIMFMIMVGGMLVVFIYMTSIASNEKFFMHKMLLFIPMIILIPSLISYMLPINSSDTINTLMSKMNETSLMKYFTQPMNIIVTMMIIYLLICLIAVVKISNIKQGPLRQTK